MTHTAKAIEKRSIAGFTLIELLICVALVGIFTAVAVVGLNGMTKTGGKSTCLTMLDSSKAAAATYYANSGTYPRTTGAAPIGFDALVTATPPILVLPSGVNRSGNVLSANDGGWSVTMTGGGGITPNNYAKTGGGVACS